MSSRSLNKVQLIGNLTRDPELRYTSNGTPVCTLGIATNRDWTDSNSQKQEETEFHRVVAWSKLAELCNQLLFKGRKVFVEGRLQTRRWTSSDGSGHQTTEVVIDDMIILDNRRRDDNRYGNSTDFVEKVVKDESEKETPSIKTKTVKSKVTKKEEKDTKEKDTLSVDDIAI